MNKEEKKYILILLLLIILMGLSQICNLWIKNVTETQGYVAMGILSAVGCFMFAFIWNIKPNS